MSDYMKGLARQARILKDEEDPDGAYMRSLADTAAKMQSEQQSVGRTGYKQTAPTDPLSGTGGIAMPFAGGNNGSGGLSKTQYRSMANAEGTQVADTANAILAPFQNSKPTEAAMRDPLAADNIRRSKGYSSDNGSVLGAAKNSLSPGGTAAVTGLTASARNVQTVPTASSSSATPTARTTVPAGYTSRIAEPTTDNAATQQNAAYGANTAANTATENKTASTAATGTNGSKSGYAYRGTEGYDQYASFGSGDQLSGYREWAQELDKLYGEDKGSIYFVDTTTMTPEQYTAWEQNKDTYNALMTAIENYDDEVAEANRTARQKEQYAGNRSKLLDEYIDETLRSMGLGDVGGMKASLRAQLENNIANYLTAAQNEKSAALAAAGDTYGKEAQAVKDQYDSAGSETYNAFLSSVVQDAENFNLKEAQAALATGQITQSQYDKIIDRYNKELDEASTAGKETDLQKWRSGVLATQNMLSSYVDDSDIIGKQFVITGKTIEPNTLWWTGGSKDTVARNAVGSPNGEQHKRVESIKTAALDGSLPNGSIVDFNLKGGTDYYVYIDGLFYELK